MNLFEMSTELTLLCDAPTEITSERAVMAYHLIKALESKCKAATDVLRKSVKDSGGRVTHGEQTLMIVQDKRKELDGSALSPLLASVLGEFAEIKLRSYSITTVTNAVKDSGINADTFWAEAEKLGAVTYKSSEKMVMKSDLGRGIL